ncbi:MAG: TetR/AcrR family transcriptional regulator [Chloroflexi bacterium]|nr:TetR/AcrR family transcriptional regulator [Chloroflexota bacterium]
MSATKLDPRVKRTRKLLWDAILDLIIEADRAGHDLEAITIQDIADRAEVNRVTFYLHYKTKSELLGDAIESRLSELTTAFETSPSPINLLESAKGYQLLFDHIAQYAALYKVLLGERGTGYVSNRIIDYMTDYASRQINLPAEISGFVSSTLLVRASASSVVSIVTWWLREGMPYSPEQMAAFCFQFCCHGFTSFLSPGASSPTA